MTKIKDILTFISTYAPPAIAWDKDNIGLQIGSPDHDLSGILLCVDVTPAVIDSAIHSGANLIISHHPFIFTPLRSIHTHTEKGRTIQKCLANDISVISAHTNLDFIQGGVSFALAEKVGLTHIQILDPQAHSTVKLEVYVPVESVDALHLALSHAGAGNIGNYSACGFKQSGTGMFMGNEHSHPSVGIAGRLEQAEEMKLEMIFPKWKQAEVLRALYATHPYEEVAYQLIPLSNDSKVYGAGAIGTLGTPMTLSQYVEFVKNRLNCEAVRVAGHTDQQIKTVAVCGGSGSEWIGKAQSAGADCYLTADLKYHQFFESTDTFSLIDAGHYETERPVLDHLQQVLTTMGFNIPITITDIHTNPVKFY